MVTMDLLVQNYVGLHGRWPKTKALIKIWSKHVSLS